MNVREYIAKEFNFETIKKLTLKIKGSQFPDDVIQDAFVIILSKPNDFLEDLKDRGKLKTYILSTIYYTTKFYNSKHNVEKRKGGKVVEFTDYLAQEDEPPYDMDFLEKEIKVAKAVENLPVEFKTIMYEYANLKSYRKVAEQVGINYGVVKRIIDFCKIEIKSKL